MAATHFAHSDPVHPCNMLRCEREAGRIKHDRQEAKKKTAVERGARHYEAPTPFAYVPPTTPLLSAVTCAWCHRYLESHPQLWATLRAADVARGTAQPFAELVASQEARLAERTKTKLPKTSKKQLDFGDLK